MLFTHYGICKTLPLLTTSESFSRLWGSSGWQWQITRTGTRGCYTSFPSWTFYLLSHYWWSVNMCVRRFSRYTDLIRRVKMQFQRLKIRIWLTRNQQQPSKTACTVSQGKTKNMIFNVKRWRKVRFCATAWGMEINIWSGNWESKSCPD